LQGLCRTPALSFRLISLDPRFGLAVSGPPVRPIGRCVQDGLRFDGGYPIIQPCRTSGVTRTSIAPMADVVEGVVA
jgi:hypothetical protein